MRDLVYARHLMIERHLRARGVTGETVLTAMQNVPRENFVTSGQEEFAYEDAPLAIGEGQTISQPYIVGLMIEKAGIQPGDAVLEIGTGSGYAAAVISRIAESIYSIERIAALADQARRRLDRLGFDNVYLRTGDGSIGWREAAPFDAILVAAGSPCVPQALKHQLEIGGRLVIPIGDEESQRLVRVVRTGPNAFDEEDLGGVRFVPLIGAQGWTSGEERLDAARPGFFADIAAAAEPLADLDDPGFATVFDRFGEKRVVLLGEASHGTSEFYRARAAITRRLIEEHGFTIVAVEADWPDAATVNRHVRGIEARVEQPPFRRFPTWMWRNREMAAFLGWLRMHNAHRPDAARQAGFYGLDLYNMSGSIAAVLRYLDEADPQAARIARERYGCLTPWQNDPATYGRAALGTGYGACEDAVVAQCRELLHRQLESALGRDDDLLDAAQNARLVASAERYYRVMYYGGAESWNLRDTHMFETLEHLLEARGENAKAVVWAHNSHIGDARQTDMGTARDEINIGQLCRERFGDEAALIGFGTHSGTVAAATDWDGPMQVKTVRPALKDSYEHVLHEAGATHCLFDFGREPARFRALVEPRLQRFIGVIYRPESERLSHYMYASLPKQYDAFVWFDETTQVTPLQPEPGDSAGADTFPFGF